MKADWLVIRSSAMCFRIDRRVPVMLFFLLAVIGVAMVMNVLRGEYPISAVDIMKTLWGVNTGNPDHGNDRFCRFDCTPGETHLIS
jgi:iron complex transport system permease protein